MKTRPIIMSAESVRAILDDRKTQTRRVVKPQPGMFMSVNNPAVNKDGFVEWKDAQGMLRKGGKRCPYGVVGDRLVVKETWRPVMEAWRSYVEYRASNEGASDAMKVDGRELFAKLKRVALRFPGARKSVNSEAWHSPLYMPRWASRITLELTDVRVERVQKISQTDALAEGVEAALDRPPHSTPKDAFAALWDSINAKRGEAPRHAPYSWDANPWVFALTFKRVTP